MRRTRFTNARLVFPDRVEAGELVVEDGRIGDGSGGEVIDLGGLYLCPGFIDLHVHGGGGADFMDLTPDAFRTVCRTHARHGTTALTPTSTTGSADDYRRFLAMCRGFRGADTGGAAVVGCHLYGPYFFPPARGCHPDTGFVRPDVDQADAADGYDAGFPLTITIAPELPAAEDLTRRCRERGVCVNVGHSHATFEQTEAAIGWGVQHVDHLFCAMSDRARLRQTQPFPMRGGVLEATLHFDELTTEVIADGIHLADSLLRMAYKLKGPDRLALVTDAMRAVDEPDGEYWFGPTGSGTLVRKRNGAGMTLDGTGLASGVMGMDHCVRTMFRATAAPLHDVIHMATLTPARIAGLDRDRGSLQPGKVADLVVLDDALHVRQVFVAGKRVV